MFKPSSNDSRSVKQKFIIAKYVDRAFVNFSLVGEAMMQQFRTLCLICTETAIIFCLFQLPHEINFFILLSDGWYSYSEQPYYIIGVDSSIFYGNATGTSGFVKSDLSFEGRLSSNFLNVTGWAGTGDWKKCESILDVPNDTLSLIFGILLDGASGII
ncbi:hypothetical protein Glove_274g16 [Diversispora epigaea]|uniref:Uncharacterized protein n=1 Tax=Diversispora epigaea TaxID=1348612 RepID=A0A397I7J0_9GLOM|nr:hypothetical protein Glove_274g16 [Diversispora epigaea]